jgi:hypothetical protein
MDEMRAQLTPHREIVITVRSAEIAEAAQTALAGAPGVIAVETLEPRGGRCRVRVDFVGDDDGVAALNQRLNAAVPVLGFTEETKDLESMFMRVTKGVVT